MTAHSDEINGSPRGRHSFQFRKRMQRTRPWYFSGGSHKPAPGAGARGENLWPDNFSGDRITSQLMYAPGVADKPAKKIHVDSMKYFRVTGGDRVFKDAGCPVRNCLIDSSMKNADAVLFHDAVALRRDAVPSSQIWILYVLENPRKSGKVAQRDSINWTATYRTDSDIVTPYAKWAYYNDSVKQKPHGINYALGKTKKVAWFVSNCGAGNRRMEFALELRKHIPVDIYGSCGFMSCPKRERKYCLRMLSRTYKFYLAFENGNCIDYITEKFFLNALGNNVIPIAMGARREDYERVAPFRSYIHVENFKDAASLANYLHLLDRNDTLYNSYFSWKGTGEFINTHFFCRLCAMLNGESLPRRHYDNFRDWWKKQGTCVPDRWEK